MTTKHKAARPGQRIRDAAATVEPAPLTASNVADLGSARQLPEAEADVDYTDVHPAEGSIHHFMDESVDAAGAITRRTMKIVANADGGVLHKMYVRG